MIIPEEKSSFIAMESELAGQKILNKFMSSPMIAASMSWCAGQVCSHIIRRKSAGSFGKGGNHLFVVELLVESLSSGHISTLKVTVSSTPICAIANPLHTFDVEESSKLKYFHHLQLLSTTLT